MTATQTIKPPSDIFPGQRWMFVDMDRDKETEYVVADPRDETQMAPEVRLHLWAQWEELDVPQSIVYLLNEKTGKYAMVTRYWLYGMSKTASSTYWRVIDAA